MDWVCVSVGNPYHSELQREAGVNVLVWCNRCTFQSQGGSVPPCVSLSLLCSMSFSVPHILWRGRTNVKRNEQQQAISKDLLREPNVRTDEPRRSFRNQTGVREGNIYSARCENPSEARLYPPLVEMKVPFFLKWDMPQSNATKTTQRKLFDWKFTWKESADFWQHKYTEK